MCEFINEENFFVGICVQIKGNMHYLSKLIDFDLKNAWNHFTQKKEGKIKFGPALKSATLLLFDYCTILQCLNLAISRYTRDYYFSLISLNRRVTPARTAACV